MFDFPVEKSDICRFCQIRWVEEREVADRVLEFWPSIVSLIKYLEGLCKSKRPANGSYEFLTTYEFLANSCIDLFLPAKLNFFTFIASIFKPYLKVFWTDATMVPFMYEELETILRRLLGLIYKKEALSEKNSKYSWGKIGYRIK